MIELLIVLTLIGTIGVLLLTAFNPIVKLANARDARRKADLQKLKNPLEDYYNDHKCYPAESIINSCNPGDGLRPYWAKIPCDPQTNASYFYELENCNTYRIYVNLENRNDPDIIKAGCTSTGGCPGNASFNWGITSPNTEL